MHRLIGYILISSAIGFTSIFILNRNILPKNLEAFAIQKIWQKDTIKLEQAKQLPASWWQIKEVDIAPLSPKAAKWLQEITPPVHYNNDGRYKLVIRLDSNTDIDTVAVIIHYTLIEIRSGNTLWEFGRTLKIPNKKWIHKSDQILAWFRSFFPSQKEYSSESPLPHSDHLEDHNEVQNSNTNHLTTDSPSQ